MPHECFQRVFEAFARMALSFPYVNPSLAGVGTPTAMAE